MLVERDIQGEPGTGFEKYDHKGPFECGNCRYFDHGICHQKVMMQKSKEPHQKGGVEVDEKDCCEYVDRIGKKGSLTEAAKRGNHG